MIGDGSRISRGGDDVVSGGDDDDDVEGDGDFIGVGGNDRVSGDAGNDTVAGDGLEGIGRGGDDRVSGGDGDDSVDGDQTNGDIATGGDDRLDGGAQADALNGDGGTDRCVLSNALEPRGGLRGRSPPRRPSTGADRTLWMMARPGLEPGHHDFQTRRAGRFRPRTPPFRNRALPTGYPAEREAVDLARGDVPRRTTPVASRTNKRHACCDRRPLLVPGSGHRAAPKTKKPHCGAVFEALCRTRTGDPFLTMAVRQSSGRLSRRTKSLHTPRIELPGMP